MLALLKPYKKQYIFGIGVGLIHVLLEMAAPKFMQYLIGYTGNYASGVLPDHPTERQAIWHVAKVIGLWTLVYAASLILQRLTILRLASAGERVQFDIRRKLFAHLQSLSMSYYDKTKLGRIISRCTSDIQAMREVNVWGIWQVIANGLIIFVAAAMLFVTEWRLFLAVAWLGPVVYFCNWYYKTRFSVMHQVSREGWTRVSTNLAENITGMRVVTAFNRQNSNLARLQFAAGGEHREQRQHRPGQRHLPAAAAAHQLHRQDHNPRVRRISRRQWNDQAFRFIARQSRGAVVACYMFWDWFMNPIINFGNFYAGQLMPAMAGAERVFNLLDTNADVKDEATAKPLPRIDGNVKFENVTFGYNPERPVLHDVTFEAKPGQMFALVGATGSGKSSIVSLIARFYQPQQGRVLVDGHDIRYVTGDSLHRQMGLVLQVNYLFTGTVMENIRYAKPEATPEDVINAAKEIGSYDSIMSLQEGFETEVGERGANMSLGQRQLICFTRAYLADPRIFMLDEATSAVDTATELMVQQSLEKLLKGRTTFVVAHRLSTIMNADVILVIEKGHIIERGSHRELIALGGKYSHLYQQFVQHAE